MSNFDKKYYAIFKSLISKELANFCAKYLILKRRALLTFYDTEMYEEVRTDLYGGFLDPQAPGSYSIYGDVAMETLLTIIQNKVEPKIKLKLFPTYAYARVYEKGNSLRRHKDRLSCEISATLNLGGDPWPIYIDPDPKSGTGKPATPSYRPGNNKGKKIILKPGDLLMYKGSMLEHWREPFDKKVCAQVFLHYNTEKTAKKFNNQFDKRPHLGLPGIFIKEDGSN